MKIITSGGVVLYIIFMMLLNSTHGFLLALMLLGKFVLLLLYNTLWLNLILLYSTVVLSFLCLMLFCLRGGVH